MFDIKNISCSSYLFLNKTINFIYILKVVFYIKIIFLCDK